MNYNPHYVEASLPHRAAILRLGYKWRNNPPYLKGSYRWTYNILTNPFWTTNSTELSGLGKLWRLSTRAWLQHVI